MHRYRFAQAPVVVATYSVSLLLLAGCAMNSGRNPVTPSIGPTAETPPALVTPAAIARAQSDSIRHPWTAADALFMRNMIGHHAQAIHISRWAPTHGANAEIQRLAARIISAQADEIAIMRRWLAARQQTVPDTGYQPMQHEGHEMHSSAAPPMSGMLSQAQMDSLDRSRGTEFDRNFLRYMIQHHRGAVAMVETLFATDGAAQDETVFKFANDVQVDQRTEVARMERMLAALIFRK
jgi:uncharacterized protein (DUF305 family)